MSSGAGMDQAVWSHVGRKKNVDESNGRFSLDYLLNFFAQDPVVKESRVYVQRVNDCTRDAFFCEASNNFNITHHGPSFGKGSIPRALAFLRYETSGLLGIFHSNVTVLDKEKRLDQVH